MIEAADGVGMTRGQKLWLVEAPLVAPVLMAGIRTAAVWTIGAATLSTTVGQPSLGDLIFAGLQTQNWALVLAGCVAAAALALAVDALLGRDRIRHRARRRRLRIWIAAVALVARRAGRARPALAAERRATPSSIGAKNFSEQYILARVIGHRLEAGRLPRRGIARAWARRSSSARSPSGDIDVYVDYSGHDLGQRDEAHATCPPRARCVAAIGDWAQRKHGVRLLGSLGFENAYAFAMRGDDAARRGIASLDDLVPRAPRAQRSATDLEFLERPEWAAVRAPMPLRLQDRARLSARPSCTARWRAARPT